MDKYLSLVAEEYEAKETGDLLEDKERVYKESLTAEEFLRLCAFLKNQTEERMLIIKLSKK